MPPHLTYNHMAITSVRHYPMWVSCKVKHFPIHLMKPCQVDWQKLVITEILFFYREIELINIIKQNEKPIFI